MTKEIDALLSWLKQLQDEKALYYGVFLESTLKEFNEKIKAELKENATENGEIVATTEIDGRTVFWQVSITQQKAKKYTVKKEAKEVRSIRLKFADEVE